MRLEPDMAGGIVSSSDDYSCFYGYAATAGMGIPWDSQCIPNGELPTVQPNCGSYATTGSLLLQQNTASTTERQQQRPKKSARKTSSGSKSTYKHVPHREKPPHLVARRNARERRRVQAVNTAFMRLRKCVPMENRNKRLSKVKTLQKAIEYIGALQDLLDHQQTLDGVSSSSSASTGTLEGFDEFMDSEVEAVVNKENEIHDKSQRWITVETPCSPDNYGGGFIPFYDDYGSSLHA